MLYLRHLKTELAETFSYLILSEHKQNKSCLKKNTKIQSVFATLFGSLKLPFCDFNSEKLKEKNRRRASLTTQ